MRLAQWGQERGLADDVENAAALEACAMCGFAGILTSTPHTAEALDQAVRRMTAPITHRGPDDEGTWLDAAAGIALGFRRLSIIDLSAHGHQPMCSPAGRFTVVFNGEVYNHGALRTELEREGVRFRGHSDTEVVAAAFERWGIARSVRQFIGMFAIAAWDVERRRLALIRDRLGIKPLFVRAVPGLVTFGSELKALAAGPEFDRTLDTDALSAYLRYLYVPAPATIYRNVRKLLPGHILMIDAPSAPLPASTPYWEVEDAVGRGRDAVFEGSDDDAVAELERLLTDAVRLRMQADVPLGALLSGGIDSSTVVALMQAAAPGRVRTFSIGFTDEAHNEAPHAARVAEHLGTDHTELVLDGTDALAVVPRLPEMFDEPLADPSQIPTHLVCALAREQVVVALSGDGGDEVFAGYNRYLAGAGMIRRLGRVPRPMRRLAAAAMTGVSTQAWDRAYGALAPLLPSPLRVRLPGEKIGKLGHLLARDSEAAMYRSLLSAWQHPEHVLRQAETGESRVEEMLDRTRDLTLLDRMMATDQATYLADDLLAKVDRASMAVSLEVRVPLIDHRVVEFGWRLPSSLKIRGGRGKWLLRQVLYRHVPEALVERPKVGFTVPIAAWLRGPLRAWAEDLLDSERLEADEILSAAPIRRAWHAFQSGHDGLALALWTVLIFQAWRERWAV
ncbi:MAG TPA: asparagine synthase (glutamine-hydrolyzing) [Longimicrobiales bacterium]